ncbi:rRNA pseudouridine synthase [bacterium]|nr:MAG: rRNA pseudouridine synthase [bacterium]
MEIRLNRYIAQAGVCSRRAADDLIARGVVRLNGEVVRDLGRRVAADDLVEVDGHTVTPRAEHVYLVLNKPVEVVTTLDDPQGRKTVAAYIPAESGRLVPVGRLDWDTSGLLLLTDDGEMVHALTHPRFGVEKTYRATLRGQLEPAAFARLRDGGIMLDDGAKTRPAKIRIIAQRRAESVVDISIHEGHYHQVRRMFDAVGHPLLTLERVRFGPVALGDLSAGTTRRLTERELHALQQIRDEASARRAAR